MKIRRTAVHAHNESDAVMLRLELVTGQTHAEKISTGQSRPHDLHVSMSSEDARALAVQLEQAADEVGRTPSRASR